MAKASSTTNKETHGGTICYVSLPTAVGTCMHPYACAPVTSLQTTPGPQPSSSAHPQADEAAQIRARGVHHTRLLARLFFPDTNFQPQESSQGIRNQKSSIV